MLHSPHKSFCSFNSQPNFELCKKYFHIQILNILPFKVIKQTSFYTTRNTNKKNWFMFSTQFMCLCLLHIHLTAIQPQLFPFLLRRISLFAYTRSCHRRHFHCIFFFETWDKSTFMLYFRIQYTIGTVTFSTLIHPKYWNSFLIYVRIEQSP